MSKMNQRHFPSRPLVRFIEITAKIEIMAEKRGETEREIEREREAGILKENIFGGSG